MKGISASVLASWISHSKGHKLLLHEDTKQPCVEAHMQKTKAL